MFRFQALALFGLVLSTAQLGVSSTDFSFTGTFASDTDIQLFTFTVLADTPDVTLLTLSYGGGVNSAGTTIDAGGFDPIISVFESDGTQMNPSSTGNCPSPQTVDPTTSLCGDAYYPTTLSFPGGSWTAGTYYVALTENPNNSLGNLSFSDIQDSFFDGGVLGYGPNTNFTCQAGGNGFQGNPPTFSTGDPFCSEYAPVQRTGSWALDILNVDSAQEGIAPEPGTALLGLLGLGGFAALRRRKN
jgi:MYXO-CTERM domain-containing protein